MSDKGNQEEVTQPEPKDQPRPEPKFATMRVRNPVRMQFLYQEQQAAIDRYNTYVVTVLEEQGMLGQVRATDPSQATITVQLPEQAPEPMAINRAQRRRAGEAN